MQTILLDQSVVNDCWNQIGVEGDRSCEALKSVIHCRNCPVYSTAGRSLLERDAPVDYLNEWTNVLAKTQPDQFGTQSNTAVVQSTGTISAMIFRLGGEWLAFPVRLLQEVTQPCVIHTLPHLSNDLFLGMVNIRGEILMCISLSNLLDLELMVQTPHPARSVASKRMVVVAKDEERWVFTVDEVCGVHRFRQEELRNAPVVVTKAAEAYTKGVLYWQGQKVNYLDAELLFYTLNRRVL